MENRWIGILLAILLLACVVDAAPNGLRPIYSPEEGWTHVYRTTRGDVGVRLRPTRR